MANRRHSPDNPESAPPSRDPPGTHGTESRSRGEGAANGIEILFDGIAGHRLNDQNRSLLRQHFACPSGGAHGIAHVMQAIKEANQIELFVGNMRGI